MFTLKTVKKDVKVVDEIFCDNCEGKLTLVVPDDPNAHPMQCRDALEIHLGGGYGMYLDLDNQELVSVFCQKCADKLRLIFPVLFNVKDLPGDDEA